MVYTVAGHQVDFSQPWKRISMADAVFEHLGVDFRNFTSVSEANDALARIGIHEPQPTVGHCMLTAFEEKVAETFIQPTLVYGHPMEVSPLAKAMREDPRFAERFEIFIAGMECGDNWSEQNDPVQLLERWRKMYQVDSSEGEFQPLDYDFLEVLEHGIPPTTGIGPGIERMAMIFTEQQDIYDVIFFPMMKPLLSEVNRAIYGVETSRRESEEA
jgi:lysyl-tRNA synthetase class 2